MARFVSDEMQVAYPEINWRGIKGLRNRIIHDYENIGMTMLWEVISANLPELVEQIERYLTISL